MGWLSYTDLFRLDPANKLFMVVDTDNEALDMFFNCNDQSIKNIASKPPANSHKAELSYQQNIFDWAFPYDIEIDF
jgi:hypothetical protein